MSATVLKSFLRQSYFKLYLPAAVSCNFLSATAKLNAKRKINIKNKFNFQDEFQRNFNNRERQEHENTFSDSFSEDEREHKHQQSDMKLSSQGFVSAELISGNGESYQRTNKSPQRQSIKKPSLMYKGEILYGVHPIYLALLQKKRTFHHLYTRQEDLSEDNISRKSEIIKLAQTMNIPVSFVDSKSLKILAPAVVHQGVCLDAGFFPFSSWNEGQSDFETSESRPLWLVLDEILDPMNVGAIIRSAHYFGVGKLFTVKGNSCKLSPTVSKASSGSLEVMDVYQIDSLEDFVNKRKENGWHIVSTLAYSENKSEFTGRFVNATDFDTSRPTILILGSEGKGVSEAILKLCDSFISIEPQHTLPEGIDSLNVSVATGVLLYILSSCKNVKR